MKILNQNVMAKQTLTAEQEFNVCFRLQNSASTKKAKTKQYLHFFQHNIYQYNM
jgi:hypothetical protein